MQSLVKDFYGPSFSYKNGVFYGPKNFIDELRPTTLTPESLSDMAARIAYVQPEFYDMRKQFPAFVNLLEIRNAGAFSTIYNFPTTWFDLNVNNFMSMEQWYDHYSERNWVNCEEIENTLTAMDLASCQRVWFRLLHKVLFTKHNDRYYMTRIGLTFYITPQHMLWLDRIDFLDFMQECATSHDLSNMLLMLSGDVESNPGPFCTSFKYKNFLRSEYQRQVKSKPRVVEANMQILGGISSAIGNASLFRVSNRATSFMDSLETQMIEALQQFRRTFDGLDKCMFATFNVIDLISDIIFALLHLNFAKESCKISALGVELARLLLKYGIKTTLVQQIKDLVFPYFTKTAQFVEDVGTQPVIRTHKVVAANLQIDASVLNMLSPTHICIGLFVTLIALFSKVLPTRTDIEGVIKRVGDISRSTKNMVDFNKTCHESIMSTLNYVKEYLGLRPVEEIENLVSGIDKWFDETRVLLTRTDEYKHSDLLLKDPKVIHEVETLYRRGLEYSREISDKGLQRELQLPFQTHMRLLTDLMKMVDTSGAFGTKPRTQPVVIWLYGDSGVGKSGMSWPLAVDLNTIFMHNAEEAKNFSRHIYMRNVEQEFWDNYQGQNVVIYDDFGQRVDSTTNPNEEFMEIIRTANIAPYPLHMAHLEDKRKTRFTSKIVLLTSNVFQQNVNSLTFPDAFRRRIDLCAKVRVKPEFCKMGFSTSDGKEVPRLDKDKVFEHFKKIISTEVYLLDLVNPESGEVYAKDLDYSTFSKIAHELTTKAFTQSQALNEYLEQYAVSAFETKANIPASLQINDKYPGMMDFAGVFYDCKEDKTSLENLCQEELTILAQAHLLEDKHGVKLTSLDDSLLYDTYLEQEAKIPYDEWRINYIKKYFFLRHSSMWRKLVAAKSNFIDSLKTYVSKTIKFIKEHPFTMVCYILGSALMILGVGHFWSTVMRQPKTELEANASGDNITLAKHTIRHEGRKPTKNIASEGPKSWIYPNNLEELWVEQGSPRMWWFFKDFSKVPGFLPQTELDPLNIAYRKWYDEGVGLFGEKAARKTHSWVIPVDTHKRWVELGSKKFFGIFPDYSDVPGFLAASTPNKLNVLYQEWLSKGKTLFKAHFEAAQSGDNLTLRPQVIQREAGVSLQAWTDQTAQLLITNRISSNLYKICRKTSEGVLPLLHGLFVRSNILLVPNHLAEFLTSDDVLELRSATDVVFTVPWKEFKQLRIKDSRGNPKEAMLLIPPNYVSQHADLVKHFSDSTSMGMYRRANTCLPVLRYNDKMKALNFTILGTHQAEASDEDIIIDDTAKGKKTVVRKHLSYTCPTINGDCGAPLIINETPVLRKIAGIHVAGAASGMGYAQSVTEADLLRTLKEVEPKLQIQLDVDDLVDYHYLFTPSEMVPSTKFIPLGKAKYQLFDPKRTSLRRSLIYSEVVTPSTMPSQLSNVVRDGEVINIKERNLEKCAKDTPFIDPFKLRCAFSLVKKKWNSNRSPAFQRVLSFEEAITGNDVSEYISPLNRSSSPGYPWVLKRPSGMKGKTGWLGADEYMFSDELRHAVEERISLAKQGIRQPAFWVDTLKDERRPIEKVKALKTRVFAAGPMDYLIAFRMYGLGYIAHLMENRITNEVSLGTNVYAQDWSRTADKLQSKGEKVFAGDFSGFDGSLNSSIMWGFLDAMNEFYDDGEENALVRTVLFSEIVNSIHICDKMVYMMTHSQPSGNPVTTPLNCWINSVTARLVFDDTMEGTGLTMFKFEDHVSMVSYGDDNVFNISDLVSDNFNMNTVVPAYAKLGFIYTDESKIVGREVPDYKSLGDVMYLRRSFVHNGDRWLAPLCLDVVLEMTNWCKESVDQLEGTRVNCETAINELAMHEVSVFDFWSKKIATAFYRKTGDILDVKPYVEYNREWLLSYFL